MVCIFNKMELNGLYFFCKRLYFSKSETAEGFHALRFCRVQQVRIYHRILQITMPEYLLQGKEVFRMPIVYRGKGVSSRLARNVFINPCDLGNLLQVLVDLLL